MPSLFRTRLLNFLTLCIPAASLTLEAQVGGLPGESLSPSCRKTGLVISEIMYKPAARMDGRNLEYVELYNSHPSFEDISGYRISGDISYNFPATTVLQRSAFV